MPQGKVKWFNNAKGYGFIISEESGVTEDLFVHFSSIQMEGYKTLKAGQTVQFDMSPSDKGIHAVNIVPLDEEPKQTDNSNLRSGEFKSSTSSNVHPLPGKEAVGA